MAKKDDRRFMELAIEEMKKSRSEHRTKSDPMMVVAIGIAGIIALAGGN